MSEIARKLASIRVIEAIDPIDGADNIVCATVDGWKLVTQKSNNFKPGDLVLYFEIDSWIPNVIAPFLSKDLKAPREFNGVPGERLRTIKLRGQVSQGLILPISEVPGAMKDDCFGDYWVFTADGKAHLHLTEGQDLTEYLNIQKWEKPLPAQLAGRVRGNFPIWIPKTDQERVQNHFKTIKKMSSRIGTVYESTLKLDGSSMTVYKNEDSTGVCSRNLDLAETEENSFWQAARKYEILEKLDSLGKNYAIQGELMGPGVQGNREGFNDLRFFVFDIYDIETRKYLNSDERWELAVDKLGLEHAPVLGQVDIADWSIEQFLADAERKSINHKIAEGIVYKNIQDPNFSFKCISNQFLLKEKD